jgi:hypothetical protein
MLYSNVGIQSCPIDHAANRSSNIDTLREGKSSDEQGAGEVLAVLEVDSAVLKARLESGYEVWPKWAPKLDGVIVCCDVSRKDSFADVEDLLRQ